VCIYALCELEDFLGVPTSSTRLRLVPTTERTKCAEDVGTDPTEASCSRVPDSPWLGETGKSYSPPGPLALPLALLYRAQRRHRSTMYYHLTIPLTVVPLGYLPTSVDRHGAVVGTLVMLDDDDVFIHTYIHLYLLTLINDGPASMPVPIANH
jgi:hypothetical protein